MNPGAAAAAPGRFGRSCGAQARALWCSPLPATVANPESPTRGKARALELLLSVGLAAAILLLHALLNRDLHYDRAHLPAFDGQVYAAMAEAPAFFTVAPWGYRVLTPWLAWALPGDAIRGFGLLASAAILAAGVVLCLYLRRLGIGKWAALGGMAVFLLSPPVRGVLRYRFLAEPVTVLLEVSFLLALEAGAPLAVVLLVGLLGVLSKEFFAVLFPMVYLVRRRSASRRTALAETALVALPALLLLFALPLFWTPHLVGATTAAPGLAAVAERFVAGGAQALNAALLAGLTPLALLGAFRKKGRSLRASAGYLVLAAFLAPFLNPTAFSAADLPRLQVYALPVVVALALVAVDRVVPHLSPPPPASAPPRFLAPAALAASAVVFALPFLVVDRYRRLDLRGEPEAARVLAICRGTLATAARLQGGETVALDAVRPALEGRQRWFLGKGWAVGERAAELVSGRGILLIPLLAPGDLEVTLDLEGSIGVARVNGERLPAPPGAVTLRLPRALLFRGDNLLEVEGAAPDGRLRLRRMTIRPLPYDDAFRALR